MRVLQGSRWDLAGFFCKGSISLGFCKSSVSLGFLTCSTCVRLASCVVQSSSGVPLRVPEFLEPFYLPLVSREWKNGSNSSYNCTPFLHSLLTKGNKFRASIRAWRGRPGLQDSLKPSTPKP